MGQSIDLILSFFKWLTTFKGKFLPPWFQMCPFIIYITANCIQFGIKLFYATGLSVYSWAGHLLFHERDFQAQVIFGKTRHHLSCLYVFLLGTSISYMRVWIYYLDLLKWFIGNYVRIILHLEMNIMINKLTFLFYWLVLSPNTIFPKIFICEFLEIFYTISQMDYM